MNRIPIVLLEKIFTKLSFVDKINFTIIPQFAFLCKGQTDNVIGELSLFLLIDLHFNGKYNKERINYFKTILNTKDYNLDYDDSRYLLFDEKHNLILKVEKIKPEDREHTINTHIYYSYSIHIKVKNKSYEYLFDDRIKMLEINYYINGVIDISIVPSSGYLDIKFELDINLSRNKCILKISEKAEEFKDILIKNNIKSFCDRYEYLCDGLVVSKILSVTMISENKYKVISKVRIPIIRNEKIHSPDLTLPNYRYTFTNEQMLIIKDYFLNNRDKFEYSTNEIIFLFNDSKTGISFYKKLNNKYFIYTHFDNIVHGPVYDLNVNKNNDCDIEFKGYVNNFHKIGFWKVNGYKYEYFNNIRIREYVVSQNGSLILKKKIDDVYLDEIINILNCQHLLHNTNSINKPYIDGDFIYKFEVKIHYI